MIGMTKPRSKKKQHEDSVIRATFDALSSALGWDKVYPRAELQAAVRARLRVEKVDTIIKFDDELSEKLRRT